jgi:hypothetical protein
MTRTLASLLCATALVLAPGSAHGIEFRSTFQSFKIAVRPGETVTRTFELQLGARQPRVHFRAHVEDWWQSEDGAQSFYREPGTIARSCGRWVTLNPAEAAVEPSGVLSIRITATVPRSVAPGGYWCVLTIDELPDPLAPPERGVGVRFLASISTGIFLFLQPVVRQIEIGAIELAPRRAKLAVRNTGNAPVWLEGHVELSPRGSEAVVVTAPLARATLLTRPFDRHFLTADLPDLSALPPGRYRMRLILDIGLDHLIGAQKELELPNDLKTPSAGR